MIVETITVSLRAFLDFLAQLERPPRAAASAKSDQVFIVHDASGQALRYFYFEEEPGRRSAAKLLTKDEARRVLRRP